jgi:hypothetical protein
MLPRPLSLNDQQLWMVQAAAVQVPPAWRSRYLEGVADRLLVHENITDDDVRGAVRGVLERIGLAARLPTS